MKKALVSVSNKTNLVDFVKKLIDYDYEIISTGGTKKYLEENDIKVKSISEITNFPEILDGRVKTLHPNVHGGLLAKRDDLKHLKELKDNNIDFIDMVVVNLYPFKETILKECSLDEAIENIDIGGPSMLRSAAKNYKFVDVICDYHDYDKLIEEIKNNGTTSLELRSYLALKVFSTTSSYDSLISNYLNKYYNLDYHENLNISYELESKLRYGENPHQKAYLYKGLEKGYSLLYSKVYQGKELSYNNIQDSNACLNIVKEFDKPCVVALKHMNPCGVGIGNDINEAWEKAYESDKVSIFGGIVGTNEIINKEVALKMKDLFLEVILAPGYTKEALEVFKKKKNLRVIEYLKDNKDLNNKTYISINGGMLVQDYDNLSVDINDIKYVTKLKPTKEELDNLIFLMKVCKYVKSNAIVVGNNYMTYGIGAGQMNRIGSCEIALNWAKTNNRTNILLASDAFFPFDDCVKLAHKYGVKAIIQPGGSIRDEDSIKACDELGIKMVFTGLRHFKH